MKATPVTNPMSDTQYEFENGQFTMSGPLHYENDVHPSIRIDGPHGIVASVFAYDSVEAALERADVMMAALAEDMASTPKPWWATPKSELKP